MSNPAMIYSTTEEWAFVMDVPEWVKRCRTCRSYIKDQTGLPHPGCKVNPDTSFERCDVCQVEVHCSNPGKCNPHNRQGKTPKLFVVRETFEEAELRRAKALRNPPSGE